MNMILGPNSTVKSTIACAYTFGALSPSTTANNAHDHVRTPPPPFNPGRPQGHSTFWVISLKYKKGTLAVASHIPVTLSAIFRLFHM